MVPVKDDGGTEENASCRHGKKWTSLRSNFLFPHSPFHVHLPLFIYTLARLPWMLYLQELLACLRNLVYFCCMNETEWQFQTGKHTNGWFRRLQWTNLREKNIYLISNVLYIIYILGNNTCFLYMFINRTLWEEKGLLFIVMLEQQLE